MERRTFLQHLGLAALAVAAAPYIHAGERVMNWLSLTNDQWKARLTPEQYRVLRDHGTERAGTSTLNSEKRAGTFYCAGCDLPLFASQTKFESGTGWPSFFQPLPGAIGTQKDTKFFMTRNEVHCSRCKGHLGHVFDDGPAPTGQRYCMNGVAMVFKPAA